MGRDEGCKICFDENQADLVSQRHAKINVGSSDPIEATITDVGSSNGIFVNRQCVFNTTRLRAGDIVQLGAGGPSRVLSTDDGGGDYLPLGGNSQGSGFIIFPN